MPPFMEMYMAVAYIVRRFELELVYTTGKDYGMVVSQFHGDFKAVTKRRAD